ncbi:hypothetical protein Calhy_0799 [Caldicellulosiruptor hydrothermalis 108]|uniref:Core-binding (CB) domain-containing protein n=1 Tax=Caldicellulosiruptor hydrothermalis (strain DSM 18901 / VKM B-2411 / 108) TaxID=632292 RepID=E4QE41_CALH1|nr:N-terminal phage integrase SAM-like domain-containing protein [Caldicellulosiruptor hydrothermalis]ADQ06535.1 hypothetical protein Calhy_0799 [Caldicellulosiruptor hydrothermalis 108]
MPAKTKKRGNNEGSIYRRKDGLWCGQITIGRDENGRQKKQYFYGKTRQEVADKIAKALNDLANGIYVDPARMLLKDWLNTWLWEYKKQTLRPSTFQDYESLINNHIIPSIGHYKLKDLRPEHLQALYNSKYESGLSLSTIKHIYVILHSSLDQALKNGHNDISTTLNIYSHVMPEIKKAAAMKLNSLFENINIKGNHS